MQNACAQRAQMAPDQPAPCAPSALAYLEALELALDAMPKKRGAAAESFLIALAYKPFIEGVVLLSRCWVAKTAVVCRPTATKAWNDILPYVSALGVELPDPAKATAYLNQHIRQPEGEPPTSRLTAFHLPPEVRFDLQRLCRDRGLANPWDDFRPSGDDDWRPVVVKEPPDGQRHVLALCPFHDDTDPSLSLLKGRTAGSGPFRCHGCDTTGMWAHSEGVVRARPRRTRSSTRCNHNSSKSLHNTEAPAPAPLSQPPPLHLVEGPAKPVHEAATRYPISPPTSPLRPSAHEVHPLSPNLAVVTTTEGPKGWKRRRSKSRSHANLLRWWDQHSDRHRPTNRFICPAYERTVDWRVFNRDGRSCSVPSRFAKEVQPVVALDFDGFKARGEVKTNTSSALMEDLTALIAEVSWLSGWGAVVQTSGTGVHVWVEYDRPRTRKEHAAGVPALQDFSREILGLLHRHGWRGGRLDPACLRFGQNGRLPGWRTTKDGSLFRVRLLGMVGEAQHPLPPPPVRRRRRPHPQGQEPWVGVVQLRADCTDDEGGASVGFGVEVTAPSPHALAQDLRERGVPCPVPHEGLAGSDIDHVCLESDARGLTLMVTSIPDPTRDARQWWRHLLGCPPTNETGWRRYVGPQGKVYDNGLVAFAESILLALSKHRGIRPRPPPDAAQWHRREHYAWRAELK